MPGTLPPERGQRQYQRPGVVLPFVPRSAGAQHQRDLRAERVFFAYVLRLADARKDQVIARLRSTFENAADAATTPDPTDDVLRQLVRELHAPDQADDTRRFELLDGTMTPAEEDALLRALYLSSAKIARVTRCLEARRMMR